MGKNAKDAYPSEAADRYIVRFPDGMRDRLKDEALKNGRSLNAEIIKRLQDSLDFDLAGMVLTAVPNGPDSGVDVVDQEGRAYQVKMQTPSPTALFQQMGKVLEELKALKVSVVGVRIKDDGSQEFIIEDDHRRRNVKTKPIPIPADPEVMDHLQKAAAAMAAKMLEDEQS